jgi:hypothetical protein
MFEESRGQGGSAVLPLFLKNRDGSKFESQLGTDLVDDYNKTRGEVPDFEAVKAGYNPAMTEARRTGNAIFDGGVRRELENNFAPVKAARVNMSRQAASDALSKTLDEIEAMQSGRGFEGDSMGNRMLKFGANKQAADTVAGANFQNISDERGIADAATNLKLSNLNLPYALANENIEFEKAPHDAYIDEVMNGLQPLSFLRIGGSQPFQYQNKPMVQPGLSVGGAFGAGAASNIGTAGTQALRQWLQRNNSVGGSGGGASGYQGNGQWDNSTVPAGYDNGTGNFGDGGGGNFGGGGMGDVAGEAAI